MSETKKTQRVTRGFSMDDDGQDGEKPRRAVSVRAQQIMNGEGKRPRRRWS